MRKDVVIINYNTPELVSAAIRSARKRTPDCKFTVFDNSDERPLTSMEGVTILDNTRGQLIDFDAMLDRYPDKIETGCNWGSEKHIASVDYLFDIFQDGFVLMDSDVLVRKDFSSFFDESVACVGTVEYKPKYRNNSQRFYPMLLWLNVPMLREKGIRFFHEGYVFKMSNKGIPYYDTGGSLYKDCKDAGLPYREVDIFEYIEHFGGASYSKDKVLPKTWLELYRGLYE